ncbi:4-oxalocrotonate tautomerase [Undibacterium sp.]
MRFHQRHRRTTSATLTCSPESVQSNIQDVKKEDWASGGMLWSDKK